MEYLLVMSLSGSTMMVLYLLIKHLLKDKVSSRLYYLITKEAVLFFLIPLPFLKGWYRNLFWTVPMKEQMKGVQIHVAWTKYVIRAGEKMYVNTYTAVQIVAVTIWLLIAFMLMMKLFLKYLRIRRVIIKYASVEMTEKQRSFMTELKEQYGVRRPVILCQGRDGDHTMAFGLFKPVIICDKDIDSWEAEIHIRHEMIHIKRLDALWKMLTRLIVILHWWNPIAWTLRRELERVCEYSCDEIIMQGKTKEEMKVYLRLLIEEACVVVSTEAASIGWKNSFADDMDSMKERMDNLMKKKSWNRYVAGMLVAVLAFANSMTVFAYRDTIHQEVSEDTLQDEVTKTLQNDTISFTPNMPEGEGLMELELLEETEIIYDKQFVDMEGNIYPYSDEDTLTTYRSCSHNYISGTLTEHTPYSNGGCEVRYYDSKRCDKCGNLIRGELLKTIIYTVCPH